MTHHATADCSSCSAVRIELFTTSVRYRVSYRVAGVLVRYRK